MFYFMISVLGSRAEYYMAFCLLDAGVTFSGQSFNGYDKETMQPKFDRMFTVNTKYTELCVFFSPTYDYNFYTIACWINECVLGRVSDKASLSSNLMTFVILMCWAGFYPSYISCLIFIFFALGNDEFFLKLLSSKPALRNRSKFVHIAILYFSCSFILT